MDWTLFYGFLVALAVFLAVWFLFVVPAERRDHERKLALIKKRIAEHQRRKADSGGDDGEPEQGRERS